MKQQKEEYTTIALPVWDWHDPEQRVLRVAVNPSGIDHMLAKLKIEDCVELKWLVDPSYQIYVWDARESVQHQQVAVGFGTHYCVKGYASKVQDVWKIDYGRVDCDDSRIDLDEQGYRSYLEVVTRLFESG